MKAEDITGVFDLKECQAFCPNLTGPFLTCPESHHVGYAFLQKPRVSWPMFWGGFLRQSAACLAPIFTNMIKNDKDRNGPIDP